MIFKVLYDPMYNYEEMISLKHFDEVNIFNLIHKVQTSIISKVQLNREDIKYQLHQINQYSVPQNSV